MLHDVVNMKWSDFEEKWPVEAYWQKGKLQEWKLSHMKMKSAWEGDLKKKNVWIWGGPGTGKSTWARRQMATQLTYCKNCNKWWDGFSPDEHKLVLIEDFPENGNILANHMKLWSDRFQFVGEVKGGAITIWPGNYFLIITSNYPIDQVFPGPDCEAIRRRFFDIEIKDNNDLYLQTQLDPSILD